VWKRTTLISAGALAALAVSTGCSSSNVSEHSAGHSPSSSATAAPSATATAEAHHDADVTFAQHMIPHHTQAIDPPAVAMAHAIVTSQQHEIDTMKGILATL
jgi:uncharacterized protein (DUF305 family)